MVACACDPIIQEGTRRTEFRASLGFIRLYRQRNYGNANSSKGFFGGDKSAYPQAECSGKGCWLLDLILSISLFLFNQVFVFSVFV